jgi:hypothetical protein
MLTDNATDKAKVQVVQNRQLRVLTTFGNLICVEGVSQGGIDRVYRRCLAVAAVG